MNLVDIYRGIVAVGLRVVVVGGAGVGAVVEDVEGMLKNKLLEVVAWLGLGVSVSPEWSTEANRSHSCSVGLHETFYKL